MSKLKSKILATYQICFGYLTVFCLIVFINATLNAFVLDELFCLLHLHPDFDVSLLVQILFMLTFLASFQVEPFINKDGSINKNPFAFKIVNRMQ